MSRICDCRIAGCAAAGGLSDAALPVGVRLASAPGGARVLFEGLAPGIGRFLQGMPWPSWVETVDSIADARRLTLLRDGQVDYEDSLDPEGARDRADQVRRNLDAILIQQVARDLPRAHPPGVKRGALLRPDEGATIAQIAEATGWAQHTVRGFFAGLKKKGHAVEVLERVRQVGPNKEGARGSFTIYRIAE